MGFSQRPSPSPLQLLVSSSCWPPSQREHCRTCTEERQGIPRPRASGHPGAFRKPAELGGVGCPLFNCPHRSSAHKLERHRGPTSLLPRGKRNSAGGEQRGTVAHAWQSGVLHTGLSGYLTLRRSPVGTGLGPILGREGSCRDRRASGRREGQRPLCCITAATRKPEEGPGKCFLLLIRCAVRLTTQGGPLGQMHSCTLFS